MATATRRIGLSLGADICWPICYEEIVKKLNLAIPHEGDSVGFEVDRVTIEPFNLRQPVKYDLVIDRVVGIQFDQCVEVHAVERVNPFLNGLFGRHGFDPYGVCIYLFELIVSLPRVYKIQKRYWPLFRSHLIPLCCAV